MKRSSRTGRGRRPAEGARFLRWLDSQADREDRIGNFARSLGTDAGRHGLSQVNYLSHLGSGETDNFEAREALSEAMTLWACSEGASAFHPRGVTDGRSATGAAGPSRQQNQS
jgi:hypothetical protein